MSSLSRLLSSVLVSAAVIGGSAAFAQDAPTASPATGGVVCEEPAGQSQRQECELDGDLKLSGTLRVDGPAGNNRVVVITAQPGSVSGLDIDKAATSGSYLRFIRNGGVATQIGGGGQIETAAWMTISGRFFDVGPNRYFVHPTDRSYMLGVYSDVLGPTAVFRSNSHSDGHNSWPLSLLSGTGRERLRFTNDGDILMGDIAADPHVPGETLQLRLTRVGDVGFQVRSTSLANHGPAFFLTELNGYYAGTSADGEIRPLVRYIDGHTVTLGTGLDAIRLSAGSNTIFLDGQVQLRTTTLADLDGAQPLAGAIAYCSDCPGGLMFGNGAEWRAAGADAIDIATTAGANAQTALDRTHYFRAHQTGAAPIATGVNSLAAGGDSRAAGTGSLALGSAAVANREGGVAIGRGASSNGVDAIAFGSFANAAGGGAIAMGVSARSERGGVAVGRLSHSVGHQAVAIGEESTAAGDRTLAIGWRSNAGAYGTMAIGPSASASGSRSMAVGVSARAFDDLSTAFGYQATAHGVSSIAFGPQSRTTAPRSIAFGFAAVAGGTASTAIGADSRASHAGSTAIGSGATTARTGQVVLGGSGTSVTVGDLSASTAAQTGTLYFATVDHSGTIGRGSEIGQAVQAAAAPMIAQVSMVSQMHAEQIAALQLRADAFSGQLSTLENRTNLLFDLTEVNRRDVSRANEGVAMALAMDTPAMSPGSSFALSYGVGYYNNRSAATAAFSARLSGHSFFSGGVGVGLNSGEVGARAGMRHEW